MATYKFCKNCEKVTEIVDGCIDCGSDKEEVDPNRSTVYDFQYKKARGFRFRMNQKRYNRDKMKDLALSDMASGQHN